MKDQIDLADVTIINSPDVRDWPVTAHLSLLEFRPTGIHVEFSKKDGPDRWPDVPYLTAGEPLQYTLWIVIRVDGRWFGSGCLEYWNTRDETGGPPAEYAAHWYYDVNRWGPMTGHQPAVGEDVGFFVSAGDARNNGQALVHERSQIVLVAFPPNTGAVWHFGETYDPVPAPVPVGPPAPAPPPVPPAADNSLSAIVQMLKAAGHQVDVRLTAIEATLARIEQKVDRPMRGKLGGHVVTYKPVEPKPKDSDPEGP